LVALPAEIRVKISSEAAGAIAMAEVSIRTIPIRDLVEQMLGVTGKDTGRLQEILRHGSLVSGESRVRWDGFAADAPDLSAVLATFPDSEPGRAFDAGRCFHVQLLAGREMLDVPRNIGAKRRMFRRRSFWEVLMELGMTAAYIDYSYRLRCDHYRLRLDLRHLEEVHAGAALLRYRKLREKVADSAYDLAEFFVQR
jgi:hypothetical protein